MKYDIIIIGSGPAGYVAAIRASQLGFKTAIIEKEHLGGICLNWGCIPTKALLKSAQVLEYVHHSVDYGIEATGKPDFNAIIQRSRKVAEKMSKGVQFLLKKNHIDVIDGFGKLQNNHLVEVHTKDNQIVIYEAKHIILATGARPKYLHSIPIDGKTIISYKEALSLKKIPESMVVIGSGAIGMELAYFYHTMGTKINIIEFLPRLLPTEDEDISKEIARLYRKKGIQIHTTSKVEKCTVKNNTVITELKNEQGVEYIESEVVLCAAGIDANIEHIGIEKLPIQVEKGKIVVNEFYHTTLNGVYAIGDIIATPALAHVASHEAIICVEHIAFTENKIAQSPIALDYTNIPSCVYTSPEVASVGITETQANEKGIAVKIGKFPFTASGKATASGMPDGFVKVIYSEKYGELLGLHMIGANVTEIIAEGIVARKLETTYHEILTAVHAHPTMHEAVMEATAQAFGSCIHL